MASRVKQQPVIAEANGQEKIATIIVPKNSSVRFMIDTLAGSAGQCRAMNATPAFLAQS